MPENVRAASAKVLEIPFGPKPAEVTMETAMLVQGNQQTVFTKETMSSQKCLWHLTLMSLSVWISMLEGQTVTASRVFLCECNPKRYCGNSELYV